MRTLDGEGIEGIIYGDLVDDWTVIFGKCPWDPKVIPRMPHCHKLGSKRVFSWKAMAAEQPT